MFCNRLLKKVCYVSLFLIFTNQLHAQNSSAPASKVKAVFLFNFTRFIDWPSSSFASPESPFIIGIIGSSPLMSTYVEEAVAGEKVGTHPIIVKHYEDEKEITDCHILYINFSNETRIKEILAELENRSVLTVGEAPGFCSLGGMVRFYTEQNKVRLQINTDVSKAAQLNISSKLLSVAKTD